MQVTNTIEKTRELVNNWKKEGKTYLLHASSKGKQVMISSLPLQLRISLSIILEVI